MTELPRWFPVTELLPEHDVRVLMTVQDEVSNTASVEMGRFDGEDWFIMSDDFDGEVTRWRKVTAWCPLPLPWKPIMPAVKVVTEYQMEWEQFEDLSSRPIWGLRCPGNTAFRPIIAEVRLTNNEDWIWRYCFDSLLYEQLKESLGEYARPRPIEDRYLFIASSQKNAMEKAEEFLHPHLKTIVDFYDAYFGFQMKRTEHGLPS